MADQIETLKVICKGGLNSNENHLDLSDNLPGSAGRLVNFEPSLFGGYRRVDGYEAYKADYQEVTNDTNPATGPVLGLTIFKDDYLRVHKTIAAREIDGTGTYGFYEYVPLVGWRLMSGAPTPSMSHSIYDVKKVRHEQFDFGGGNTIVFVDGVNPPTVFDSQNWYSLEVGNTGGELSAGGDQLVARPAVVTVFERHIFFSGDPSYPAVIAHSAPDDVLTWTAAAGAGQITAGTDVSNIKPFRDTLYVFGTNSIKKINVDVANLAFTLESVTTNVGCIARDSVVEIGGDLMFLSPGGFRPVSATSRIGDVELESVSKNIQGVVVDLIKNYDLTTLNSVVLRSKNQVRFFVGDEAFTVPDAYGIIGGLVTDGSSLQWEFGTLLGIRASACFSAYIEGEEVVLHGDYDGKVYKQEVGNDFAGVPILSIYSTPYFDMGDPGSRKTIRQLNTFIRAEGPFEMAVEISYDWGDQGTMSPNSYTQQSEGAPTVYAGRDIEYGSPVVIYGGSEKPLISSNVEGSGFSARFTYVAFNASNPFSIQGLVIDYSQNGRR